MSSARRPRPRLLPIAIAAVLGVGLAAIVLWLAPVLLQSAVSTQPSNTVDATVSTTAPCDGPSPHDAVSYTVSGQEHTVKLDGCGARAGEHLRVALPSGGEQYATRAGAADGTGSSRLAFVLLAIAAIGGGLIPGLRAPVRRTQPS